VNARPALVPVAQIVAMLASRIQPLVDTLLPHGRARGHEWVALNIRRGERSAGALSVNIGSRPGIWSDFAEGVGGDALDLIAYWECGGDKRRALGWARRWLGLDNGDPAALAVARQQAEARVEQSRAEQGEAAAKARNAAFRIWLGAEPNLDGTPVEYYLAGRNIELASMPRPPRALRFHPGLHNTELGRPLPAMVAAVTGPDGKFLTIHRTWLEQAGPGDWRKARLESAKKVYSSYRGGCIRLARPAGSRPWADMPAGSIVDISEGIEDGLSVAVALPDARVIAAIALGNAASIPLPAAAATVRFWRQRDTSAAAINAADLVVRTWLRAGHQVVIPDMPFEVKDVNELQQRAQA
jgi:hypothetical protein